MPFNQILYLTPVFSLTYIYLLCYCIEQKNTSINYFYLFEKHSVSISSDIQFPQSDPAANRIFNCVFTI